MTVQTAPHQSQLSQSLTHHAELDAILPAAANLRDARAGRTVSYSRKIFIPLTRLCRDVCHYCTFATTPRHIDAPYLLPDQVLAVARTGAAHGCKEALFTLGDKPELRYRQARAELERLGYATTVDYLAAMAELVFTETGLLPHINAGVMGESEIARLRPVSASQGLMLESASTRLTQRDGPHFGSPDKDPAIRVDMIAAAGRQRVPFTSGILVGIGDSRAERLTALRALKDLHETHGHLQEIIVQPFRAKPGTRMANHPDAPLDELLWTIAAARLVFGPDMCIQTPPNLSPDAIEQLLAAGIDDWGGVSPITPDHVNPEAPWPHVTALEDRCAAAGFTLVERLAVHPRFALQPETWLDKRFHAPVLRAIDCAGLVRDDDWTAGGQEPPPRPLAIRTSGADAVVEAIDAARSGKRLSGEAIERLFHARGSDAARIVAAADALRAQVHGDVVTYVVNRNINYTNICAYRCSFCAFSKGKTADHLRGKPYNIGLEEIVRRVGEAWDRGATEVCLQGGIHPEFTGNTYLDICRAVKSAAPRIHVHAFSPLEVTHGAETLGINVPAFLERLREAGLGSLPGTAAEILDDTVRSIICPDKLDTGAWLSVMKSAHEMGLRSTATIMFGHVERPIHWARHLLRVRDLQFQTGGFTEFVPLPFVPFEAPIARKGLSRPGPTFRETLLMHAVARLVLHPVIPNIQASWVKLGREGVKRGLAAGVNDLGGTLMNESITRAAGATHGQELDPAEMSAIIECAGRIPRQRTTLYMKPDATQETRSLNAAPLSPVVNELCRPTRQAAKQVAVKVSC